MGGAAGSITMATPEQLTGLSRLVVVVELTSSLTCVVAPAVSTSAMSVLADDFGRVGDNPGLTQFTFHRFLNSLGDIAGTESLRLPTLLQRGSPASTYKLSSYTGDVTRESAENWREIERRLTSSRCWSPSMLMRPDESDIVMLRLICATLPSATAVELARFVPATRAHAHARFH